jgi:hypothetical protein
MTAMMIIAALLGCRWTTSVGTRWLLVVGCLLFAAGLLLANLAINPRTAYKPLAAALGSRWRWHRPLRRTGHLVRADSGTRRAIRDGRLGHEYQPGIRRCDWHRHPWSRRQR